MTKSAKIKYVFIKIADVPSDSTHLTDLMFVQYKDALTCPFTVKQKVECLVFETFPNYSETMNAIEKLRTSNINQRNHFILQVPEAEALNQIGNEINM